MVRLQPSGLLSAADEHVRASPLTILLGARFVWRSPGAVVLLVGRRKTRSSICLLLDVSHAILLLNGCTTTTFISAAGANVWF